MRQASSRSSRRMCKLAAVIMPDALTVWKFGFITNNLVYALIYFSTNMAAGMMTKTKFSANPFDDVIL